MHQLRTKNSKIRSITQKSEKQPSKQIINKINNQNHIFYDVNKEQQSHCIKDKILDNLVNYEKKQRRLPSPTNKGYKNKINSPSQAEIQKRYGLQIDQEQQSNTVKKQQIFNGILTDNAHTIKQNRKKVDLNKINDKDQQNLRKQLFSSVDSAKQQQIQEEDGRYNKSEQKENQEQVVKTSFPQLVKNEIGLSPSLDKKSKIPQKMMKNGDFINNNNSKRQRRVQTEHDEGNQNLDKIPMIITNSKKISQQQNNNKLIQLNKNNIQLERLKTEPQKNEINFDNYNELKIKNKNKNQNNEYLKTEPGGTDTFGDFNSNLLSKNEDFFKVKTGQHFVGVQKRVKSKSTHNNLGTLKIKNNLKNQQDNNSNNNNFNNNNQDIFQGKQSTYQQAQQDLKQQELSQQQQQIIEQIQKRKQLIPLQQKDLKNTNSNINIDIDQDKDADQGGNINLKIQLKKDAFDNLDIRITNKKVGYDKFQMQQKSQMEKLEKQNTQYQKQEEILKQKQQLCTGFRKIKVKEEDNNFLYIFLSQTDKHKLKNKGKQKNSGKQSQENQQISQQLFSGNDNKKPLKRLNTNSSENNNNNEQNNNNNNIIINNNKYQLNLQHVIELLKNQNNCIKFLNVSQRVLYLQHCRIYLELISQSQTDSLEKIYEDPELESEIRKSMVMERLIINMIIYMSFDQNKDLKEELDIFLVILKQFFNNSVLILNILLTSIQIQDDSLLQNKNIQDIKELIFNEEGYQQQTDDTLSSINNLIILNLHKIKKNNASIVAKIQKITKNIPDLQQIFNELLKNFKTQTVQEALSFILDFFAQKIKQQQEVQDNQKQEEESKKANEKLQDEDSDDEKNIKNYQNFISQSPPYIRKKISKKFKYTLVLDLDETLIHYVDTPSGGHFLTRPYLETFLREMYQIYELVVFTAGMEDYANWVIDTFDKNQYIKYRLFRQHTKLSRSCYIKDLTKIGRNVQTTIIIDNTPENYKLQNSNGVRIKTWLNDPHDTALKDLIPVLKQLIENNPSDIRVPLKEIGKSELVQEIYAKNQQLRNQLQKQKKIKINNQMGYNLPFSFPQ